MDQNCHIFYFFTNSRSRPFTLMKKSVCFGSKPLFSGHHRFCLGHIRTQCRRQVRHNYPRRRTCRRIRFERNVEITKWNNQKYHWWCRFQRTNSLQEYSTFRNVLTTFHPSIRLRLTRDGAKTHKKFLAGRNQFALVVMLLVINTVLLIMLLQLAENSKLFLLQMMVLQLKSWKSSTLVVSY